MDNLLKPETVAPKVGLSLGAFYAACRAKQFPHVRIGKRIRVPESALKQWIDEQLTGKSPAQPAASAVAQ